MLINDLYETAKQYIGMIRAEKPYYFSERGNKLCLVVTDSQAIVSGVTSIRISNGRLESVPAEMNAVSAMLESNITRAVNMIVVSFDDLSIVPPCSNCLERLMKADNGNSDCDVAADPTRFVPAKSLCAEVSSELPSEFAFGFDFDDTSQSSAFPTPHPAAPASEAPAAPPPMPAPEAAQQQPYPNQPYPQHPYPNQPYQQPYPNQPYPQQPYPNQPYQQPYPNQPYPQQPYPNQPYQQQPYPNQPYPQQPYPNQPQQPYPNQQSYPQAQPYQQPQYPQSQPYTDFTSAAPYTSQPYVSSMYSSAAAMQSKNAAANDSVLKKRLAKLFDSDSDDEQQPAPDNAQGKNELMKKAKEMKKAVKSQSRFK